MIDNTLLWLVFFGGIVVGSGTSILLHGLSILLCKISVARWGIKNGFTREQIAEFIGSRW